MKKDKEYITGKDIWKAIRNNDRVEIISKNTGVVFKQYKLNKAGNLLKNYPEDDGEWTESVVKDEDSAQHAYRAVRTVSIVNETYKIY